MRTKEKLSTIGNAVNMLAVTMYSKKMNEFKSRAWDHSDERDELFLDVLGTLRTFFFSPKTWKLRRQKEKGMEMLRGELNGEEKKHE